MITLVALALGGLMTIPFFLPIIQVFFDTDWKEVCFDLDYALGIRRSGAFPIRAVKTEVAWGKNSEYPDRGSQYCFHNYQKVLDQHGYQ